MMQRIEKTFAGRKLVIETGRMAKQAAGSALVQFGDTMVLAAVTVSDKQSTLDFFPLLVEYREKTYAAGKIPGGFIKREGRPSDNEILSARIIDRSIRPLFPEGFKNEVQVFIYVISADQENDADVLRARRRVVRAERLEDPVHDADRRRSRRSHSGQVGAQPDLPAARLQRHGARRRRLAGLDRHGRRRRARSAGRGRRRSDHGRTQGHPRADRDAGRAARKIGERPKKMEWTKAEAADGLDGQGQEGRRRQDQGSAQPEGQAHAHRGRREGEGGSRRAARRRFPGQRARTSAHVLGDVEYNSLRAQVLDSGSASTAASRTKSARITIDTTVLPRAHGSALFTRGQTQALVAATLGTGNDVQRLDSIDEAQEMTKSFMLHYNFPPFSTGEVRPMRGTSRREIGHGNLAERALQGVLPAFEEFPYTIRIVSDILESNGSSSMASVCGGSLALFDAGVPIRGAVAGVAMGLIKEGKKYAILTDILGTEDHLGDMDFKVAGTRNGITSIQMDIKIEGLDLKIMKEALAQAKEGRLHILGEMDKALPRRATICRRTRRAS